MKQQQGKISYKQTGEQWLVYKATQNFLKHIPLAPRYIVADHIRNDVIHLILTPLNTMALTSRGFYYIVT